jgi:hypothetical protein
MPAVAWTMPVNISKNFDLVLWTAGAAQESARSFYFASHFRHRYSQPVSTL